VLKLQQELKLMLKTYIYIYIHTHTHIYLRQGDHSSRGVLPAVVRRCAWSRNLKTEKAMTRDGSQRQNTHTHTHTHTHIYIYIHSTLLYISKNVTVINT